LACVNFGSNIGSTICGMATGVGQYYDDCVDVIFVVGMIVCMLVNLGNVDNM